MVNIKGTKRVFSTYDMVFVGVMSAAVFVSNFLSIQLGEVSRIHFGNVFCVLAGLLLGSLRGGLCGGIGSFFYDLCNPLFVAEAPITFLMKFVLGAVVGSVSHAGKERTHTKNLLGALSGSLCYVVLYLGKNFIQQYFLIKNPMSTTLTLLVTKGTASLINAGIAVVVAMLLFPIVEKILSRSGALKKL